MPPHELPIIVTNQSKSIILLFSPLCSAYLEVQTSVFWENFLMLLKQHNPYVYLAKLWQYSKYESMKSEAPFHVVRNCGNFWQIFSKKKRRNLQQNNLFWKHISKNGENSPKKNNYWSKLSFIFFNRNSIQMPFPGPCTDAFSVF